MTAAAVLTATPHVVNRSCRRGGSGEMGKSPIPRRLGHFTTCRDPGGQDYPPVPPKNASGALQKDEMERWLTFEQGGSVSNERVAH